MVDLRQLKIFLTVAESGSFTEAANRLFMTQPAVSQSINQLERELDQELFTRKSRGVEINEAGEFVQERAQSIISAAGALKRDLQARTDGTQRIRIGAFPTAGIELLPKALNILRETRPDLRIEVQGLYSTDPVALIREDEADLILLFEYVAAPRARDKSMRYVEVLSDPLLVLLRRDHPCAKLNEIPLTLLTEENWVLRAHRPPYERIHEQMFRTAKINPKISFWTDDYQSLQGLVAAGVGVSIAPKLATVEHRSDIVAIPLSEPMYSRKILLVATETWSKTAEYSSVVEAFVGERRS